MAETEAGSIEIEQEENESNENSLLEAQLLESNPLLQDSNDSNIIIEGPEGEQEQGGEDDSDSSSLADPTALLEINQGNYDDNDENMDEDNLPVIEPSTIIGNLRRECENGSGDSESLSSSNATFPKRKRSNDSYPSECPICGDQVNGIHYGVHTCEACKNFFKRSIGLDKPYICKGNNDCDVTTFEADGTRRRVNKCQACRYQACVDVGMTYAGPVKNRDLIKKKINFNSTSSNIEEDIQINPSVSVTRVQNDLSSLENSSILMEDKANKLKLQELESMNEILSSRVRDMSQSVREKDHQITLYKNQVSILQSRCNLLDKINRERKMEDNKISNASNEYADSSQSILKRQLNGHVEHSKVQEEQADKSGDDLVAIYMKIFSSSESTLTLTPKVVD